MQAVVLAAGRGTRLGHLTSRRSKAMLPVAREPLVGRVMERLWAAGLRRFVVGGEGDGSDFVAQMLACLAETGADGVLALLRMSPERLQHSAAVELTTGERVRHIVEKLPPGSTESDAGSIARQKGTPVPPQPR